MMKQISPCKPAPLLPFLYFSGGGFPVPGFFSVLLMFCGILTAHGQTDSLQAKDSIIPDKVNTVDLRLSTDTNSLDVRDAVSSLYVPDQQELRRIPASKIRSYQAEKAFEYANDPAYWRREQPKVQNRQIDLSLYFRIFLYVCGGFLIYGIYRLAKENFSGVFSRRAKKTKADQAGSAEEDDSITDDDLEDKLAAAIGRGDLSTGVRLLYLRLIRGMRERQLVPPGSLATNRAWSAVFSDPAQARQFRSLAGAYEYVVYGGFKPDSEQFRELQKRFSDFHEKLPG